jgi:hypothetical protein
MKIQAIWKSKNPFNPDVDMLRYQKTVEVPDDVDIEELKKLAVKDSKDGYVFEKFNILK